MRILFLTFYYEPDLCAGSFRSSALIKELKKYKDIDIDIVTTLPNRYAQYAQNAQTFEKVSENCRVYRMHIPSHKSGFLDQMITFMYYFRAAYSFTRNRDYDFVFATSSRLFTAVLGAKISRKKRKPLFLDIRDIFSKNTKHILRKKKITYVKLLILLLEKYAFSTATKINLVSAGFSPYLKNKFPGVSLSYHTNGIDDIFLNFDYTKKRKKRDRLQILYAGNIGEGQGLHKIIPQLGKMLEDNVDLLIIGDGGCRNDLLKEIKTQSCFNINIMPPVGREDLLNYYKECDILFIHLNDFDAFDEVIPSKIFEYAATGKPILAGVRGFSRKFIQDNVENCEVFEPSDLTDCIKAYSQLDLGLTVRDDFKTKYTRSKIMSAMASDIYNNCKASLKNNYE